MMRVDRLDRTHRVQRREHEVPGLRGGERGPHGLGVAHLADEDHIGVLAQHALQRVVEVVGVRADLALVHDRALVGVQHLDRVLDRHDVARLVLVDVVDHRRERGRLARAGRTGDEHQTALLLGQPTADRREPELLHRRDAGQHAPQHETDGSALAEDVDAEASEPGERVGEVGLVVVEELVGPGLGQQCERDPLGVRRRDRLAVPRLEMTVDPEERGRADLDVDVGCLESYGLSQQVVEIEHGSSPSGPCRHTGCLRPWYRPARRGPEDDVLGGLSPSLGGARGPRPLRRPWSRGRLRCPAHRRPRCPARR